MTTTHDFSTGRTDTLTKAIYEHWYIPLAQGIILCILGLGAILVPPLAGLVTAVFVGAMLFAGGLVGVVSVLWRRRMTGFWRSLLMGIVAIIAGSIMIWNPAIGLVSLTSLMIAYFIVNGVLAISLSIQHRDEQSGSWGWLLAYGILDLAIAGLFIAGLPGTFLWALGLVIGIDLVFGGGALIALALAAPEPSRAATA